MLSGVKPALHVGMWIESDFPSTVDLVDQTQTTVRRIVHHPLETFRQTHRIPSRKREMIDRIRTLGQQLSSGAEHLTRCKKTTGQANPARRQAIHRDHHLRQPPLRLHKRGLPLEELRSVEIGQTVNNRASCSNRKRGIQMLNNLKGHSPLGIAQIKERGMTGSVSGTVRTSELHLQRIETGLTPAARQTETIPFNPFTEHTPGPYGNKILLSEAYQGIGNGIEPRDQIAIFIRAAQSADTNPVEEDVVIVTNLAEG
ncbi:hypothetical protein B5G09_11830 [Alistipes sp. An54]|nr:hypothetical protein B5G09_11830 [Alistipes sp. An54]